MHTKPYSALHTGDGPSECYSNKIILVVYATGPSAYLENNCCCLLIVRQAPQMRLEPHCARYKPDKGERENRHREVKCLFQGSQQASGRGLLTLTPEDDGDEAAEFQSSGKIGAKKQRKLEEKQARKAQREVSVSCYCGVINVYWGNVVRFEVLTPGHVCLLGVIDDRGKFIYITPEEMTAVAQFIKQRGRVSIAELAEASNSLINLQPESRAVTQSTA
uniref:DDRGK domain containing 1 n=1 Tax=Chrysemys picta bellii TaxID=8478 RepID=A0A8C3IL25_CHRPI